MVSKNKKKRSSNAVKIKKVKKAKHAPKRIVKKIVKKVIKKAVKNVVKRKEKILPWQVLIVEVVGEDVLPLLKLIKNKKNVSEFKIASGLKQEINETRNMLYRLYEYNLVRFERKKDKKKGWYIYYWTFNPNELKYLERNIARDKVERIKERLIREQSSQFYHCSKNCIRLDFEQATRFGFRCPECNEIVQIEDNTDTIKKLQDEVKRLEIILKNNK